MSETNPELSRENAAIEEIKAILRKHDLAGMVCVQSPDRSAYLHEITPSWSCAFFEQRPEGLTVRMRSKRTDYATLEDQKRAVTATISMVLGFLNQAERTAEAMAQVAAMIGRHFPEITHWERE